MKFESWTNICLYFHLKKTLTRYNFTLDCNFKFIILNFTKHKPILALTVKIMFDNLIKQVSKIIVGNKNKIKLTLAAILSG